MSLKGKIRAQEITKLKQMIEGLKKPIDKRTAESLGTQVVIQMRKLIAAGISPIKSVGRFPRYKNPKRYPGDRKAKSPVNLKLSGDFLDALQPEVSPGPAGYQVTIGYEGKREELKEQGHREGANGQPSRPTIPSKRLGEEFAATIERIIMGVYRDRIRQILRKK